MVPDGVHVRSSDIRPEQLVHDDHNCDIVSYAGPLYFPPAVEQGNYLNCMT